MILPTKSVIVCRHIRKMSSRADLQRGGLLGLRSVAGGLDARGGGRLDYAQLPVEYMPWCCSF